jgi:hypothetical protein
MLFELLNKNTEYIVQVFALAAEVNLLKRSSLEL